MGDSRPVSGRVDFPASRHLLISGAVLLTGLLAVACGGSDDRTASETPVTAAPTVAPIATPTVAPTPYVRMPAPDGCAPSSPGEVHHAFRSPASPYLVHHPAVSSPETPTVIFLPGGRGQQRHAERVWERFLSNGDGVDEFRLVVPYAEDIELIDDDQRIMKIVDEVLARYGGDPMKVHLAGTSNGGHIAFDLMVVKAGRFASLLGAPGEFAVIRPDRWREKLAGASVFNGVGANDDDWLEGVRLTHEGLLEAGVDSVYVEFPGQGHSVNAEFDESIFFEFWSSH